jgi:RimJ/RimL family protein N-acetyltransferase
LVARELRGQGLASRALIALIDWGTRELGLERVKLGCHVENVASRRVAEKCGFVLVERVGDELRSSAIPRERLHCRRDVAERST